MAQAFESGAVSPLPRMPLTPMARPQVSIERLPTRRMSNEPRESMNCKSCRKRKVFGSPRSEGNKEHGWTNAGRCRSNATGCVPPARRVRSFNVLVYMVNLSPSPTSSLGVSSLTLPCRCCSKEKGPKNRRLGSFVEEGRRTRGPSEGQTDRSGGRRLGKRSGKPPGRFQFRSTTIDHDG